MDKNLLKKIIYIIILYIFDFTVLANITVLSLIFDILINITFKKGE